MTSAVLAAPRTVATIDVERPEPGPGEIRVRVEGSGVCASNLEVWAGQPWFRYPLEPGAPGHEGWGRVDALGPGVAGPAVGTPVVFLSGRAYAPYDVARADAVVPLPASVAAAPFPGEAFGCAMNIFRRSDVRAGDAVAIVGIGFLGAVLTRLASVAGARVIAIGRRPFALDLARRLDAVETIAFGDRADVAARVAELTAGIGCPRVVEAVGRQDALDLATDLTAEGGRLVIAGYHQDGPRRVDMQLWNWRGLDVVNAHERDPRVVVDGMRRAIDVVERGILDPARFVTHRFPLAALGDALAATASRPDGFLKAVVMP